MKYGEVDKDQKGGGQRKEGKSIRTKGKGEKD
jgi:hypothetical protein